MLKMPIHKISLVKYLYISERTEQPRLIVTTVSVSFWLGICQMVYDNRKDVYLC